MADKEKSVIRIVGDSMNGVPEPGEWVGNGDRKAQQESEEPSWFVPGQLYQVYTPVIPLVGTYQGMLTVDFDDGIETLLVFSDAHDTLVHVKRSAILAYFPLTEEQLLKARRDATLAQLRGQAPPPNMRGIN